MRRARSVQATPAAIRFTPRAAVVSLALGMAQAAWAGQAPRPAAPPLPPPVEGTLQARIAALDAAVFDAFNRCDRPGQLDRHAAYFDPSVEFYHDTGGVTWTREAMLANTRAHACGRFRRELVPGTLRVVPVKDFGAIETGVHRFCQADTGRCAGEADFAIVWREQAGQWRITRVLSYGHRAAADPGARAAP